MIQRLEVLDVYVFKTKQVGVKREPDVADERNYL
jgi:hypothetical protein